MKSPEAERYCLSREYRLVEIYNQNQQDFIVDKCTEFSGAELDKGFWIGLKRTQGTSIWKWLDSHITPEFTAWADSNPDNGTNELLAAVYEKHDYKWVDLSFHNYYYETPICQKLKKYNQDCSCLEDLDIDWFDAKHLQFGCIGLVKTEMKSSEAENYCVSRGYRLVEIYDQNQQDFMVEKCSEIVPSGLGFWIGLKRTQGTSTWKWLDSDIIPKFTAWSGEPYNGDDELLAVAHKYHAYKWAEFNKPNYYNSNPICQILN